MKIKKLRSELFLLPFVLVCIAGCRQVNMQFNAYLSPELPFPKPGMENTVAVVVGTDSDNALLQAEVAEKIAHLLRERGYWVQPKESARYLVSCWFAMDSGQTYTGVMPVYEPGGYATTHIYGSRGRWRTVTTYLPGYTDYVPYSYTIYCKYLSLTLYDNKLYSPAADNTAKHEQSPTRGIIWRCTNINPDSSVDLRWRINHLLITAMDYFGSATQKQITLKIDDRDERIVNIVQKPPKEKIIRQY